MTDDPTSFTDWLTDALPIPDVPNKKYRHRRLDENQELRERILPRLKEAVHESLQDMARALINPQQNSLDHLQPPQRPTVADLYPQELPTKIKMEYFGEFFAGVLCVDFRAFDESRWEVPAHLFRWHNDISRYLIRVRTGNAPREIFGRTGDDCLAFCRDENGKIVRFVACEAKCYQNHDNRAVKEAYKKLSKPGEVAEDRIQLIKVLEERQKYNPDSKEQEWINALYEMEYSEGTSKCVRYDLVCYICGQAPVRRNSWINRADPSSEYTGDRSLEAVEVHIDQVRDLVLELYGKSQRERVDDESD
ncbi:MAG: hypothetical protein SXV54_01395 [Chloroflexota bacterium]|nr:hypothetical protein [Chloroflexota bacterium]